MLMTILVLEEVGNNARLREVETHEEKAGRVQYSMVHNVAAIAMSARTSPPKDRYKVTFGSD